MARKRDQRVQMTHFYTYKLISRSHFFIKIIKFILLNTGQRVGIFTSHAHAAFNFPMIASQVSTKWSRLFVNVLPIKSL